MATEYSTLAEAVKDETTFDVDEFNKNKIVSSKGALALKLQNLCFTRPNTLPNLGDFGIGLQDYAFELNDQETFNAIQKIISDSVARWIPNAPISNVRIEQITSGDLNGRSQGFLVGFFLGESEDDNTIILGYYSSTDNSAEVTEIYI
jgi:hypothetical protein